MGPAVWYRARSELRSSWRAVIVLVLLLGIAGGAVLASAAGSRRTGSAYDRMFERSEGFDLLVNPDDGDTDFDAIEALPGVAEAGRLSGTFVIPLTSDGELDEASQLLLVVSDGRLGYDLSRPVQLDGRMPARDNGREAFLPRAYAEKKGLDVGDTWHLAVLRDEESAPEPYDVTVTGIGVYPGDALQSNDDYNETQTALLSPGFFDANPELFPFFTGSFVRLRPGASTLEFRTKALELAGEEIFFLSRAETQAKAERALRPYSAALAMFAAIAALAAVLILGQAVGRHLSAQQAERKTLAAVGMSPRQELAVTTLRALVIGLGGTVVAVVLAVALSTRMPIGPAHGFEPDPGVDVDLAVIGVGAGAIVLVAVLAGCVVSLLARSHDRSAPLARPSLIVDWLARRVQGPPAAAGARMALEPGSGVRAVPVRTTLVGAMFGVAVVVAVLTFAAALDRLLSTPRLYGWSWDAMLIANSDLEEGGSVGATASKVRGVRTVTGGEFAQVELEGLSVAAVGLDRGGIELPQLIGRAPADDDEIVLGATTLRRIRRSIGDSVDVGGAGVERKMQIVGTVTFPRFAAYPGADKTGLGDGAAMTAEAVNQLFPVVTENDEARDFYLVDADQDGLHRLGKLYPSTFSEEDAATLVTEPQRPDDLTGYDKVNRTPLVLAGLLGLLAAGATAHGVVQASRRRRHDLAVLRALGFTPGQVRRTVRWHAVTIAMVALTAGLPIGVAAGRMAWTALAERLGTSAPSVVPWLAVGLTIPVVLALLNAVAAVPARRTSSISPAEVLRAE